MNNRGLVPAAPFVQLILNWETETSSIADLAKELGREVEGVRKLRNGKRPWIGFDLADKIVAVCTDGMAWHENPELRELYDGYDLRWLDEHRPTVPVAA